MIKVTSQKMEGERSHMPIPDVDNLLKQGRAEVRQNAEKRRLEGLQRIKTNSSSMNAPGSVVPLSRFPEEVWHFILDQLKEPQDLQNAWNTSPLFQKVLEKRRLRDILMPLVMNIKNFQSMLPYSSKNAGTCLGSLSHLLPLRLVCKKWRDSVDLLFQRNIEMDQVRSNELHVPTAYFAWPDLEVRINEVFIKKCLKVFRSQKYFKDFSSTVGPNPARRFIFRSLGITMRTSFYEDEEPNLQTFMTSITQFLEVIGDQILHLHLDLGEVSGDNEDDLSTSMLYKAIVKWLGLTPNLIYLHLHLGRWYNRRRQAEDSISVQEVIGQHPFPSLKKLKTIKFSWGDGDCSSANILCFQAALESNRHVKELAVDFSSHPIHEHTPELKGFEGLIRTLNLDSFSCFNYAYKYLPDAFQNLIPRITNFQWPLKRIDLTFTITLDCLGPAPRVSASKIFRFLERFQTLEDVGLTFKRICIRDAASKDFGVLNLPHLRRYYWSCDQLHNNYFEISDFTMSIDYLVNCKKLEEIVWDGHNLMIYEDYEMSAKDRHQDIIQFQGGLTDMKRSNIWSLLPALQTVQIKGFYVASQNSLRKSVETFKRGDRHGGMS